MDNKKSAYTTAYTLISNMNIIPSDKYTFKDRGWYFISGPMSKYPNCNAGAFYECEQALYRMIKSPYVYNPAKKIPKDSTNPKPHCYYMRHTLSTLSNYMFEDWLKIDVSKPLYDAIILLPGWERSNGAVLEAIVASECDVDVVEWVE